MNGLSWIKQWGPIKTVRKKRCRRYFESNDAYSMHWGVFRTFDEATANAPTAVGYNRRGAASDFNDRLDKVFPYDYPVLFWLDRIFARASTLRLFDIGGGIGVHYYAYKKYLSYPAQLIWQICEVDEVVRVGRTRATEAKANQLHFTSSTDDIRSGALDVILSAGALHYIEGPPLWDVAEGAKSRPRNILLNKLPLHDGDEFVSLQNLGSGSFSPLHIWNRGRFVERFQNLGYSLVDTWTVPERMFRIFDDEVKPFSFSGIYLRLD